MCPPHDYPTSFSLCLSFVPACCLIYRLKPIASLFAAVLPLLPNERHVMFVF